MAEIAGAVESRQQQQRRQRSAAVCAEPAWARTHPTIGRGLPLVVADWSKRAVCAQADPDALFVTGAAQREAARMCAACPVRLECLADALDAQVEFGVWGGTTERQRRALLKRSPEVTNWREVLTQAREQAVRPAAS